MQRYMEGISIIRPCVYGQSNGVHGISDDTLKVYDIVYQQYFKRNIKRS